VVRGDFLATPPNFFLDDAQPVHETGILSNHFPPFRVSSSN
jgi:hypothetical protein